FTPNAVCSQLSKVPVLGAFVQCIVKIAAMRDENLRRLDLNLLRALVVLLEERHVTRAAERCFLSQPAMSRTLARLPDTFGDEVLVRPGRAYERTPRGQRLLAELEMLLPRLDSLWQAGGFDPALCEECFQMALIDHACIVVLPDLVQRVAAAAPRARLEVAPWHDRRIEDLEAGRRGLGLCGDVAAGTLGHEGHLVDDCA